ncbi:hypothetical protein BA1DRAFT_00856 [Photorhabdus aegyptia]|uniref:Uncharacterized protein n=1 Tax=Photorhabdus aegyptia TaxID=2805098 RepID=A0A022PKC9_9GAMM|nr:hypothetical protein BA1DRAFT_00856 [Photorhabdus aegyptia]
MKPSDIRKAQYKAYIQRVKIQMNSCQPVMQRLSQWVLLLV